MGGQGPNPDCVSLHQLQDDARDEMWVRLAWSERVEDARDPDRDASPGVEEPSELLCPLLRVPVRIGRAERGEAIGVQCEPHIVLVEVVRWQAKRNATRDLSILGADNVLENSSGC